MPRTDGPALPRTDGPALPRRSALIAALGVAVGATGLGGCTSGPAPTASGVTTTPEPSTSTSTTGAAPLTVTGGDDGIREALTSLYAGRTGVSATVTTGTWFGERVAVATAGGDATLLVAAAAGTPWRVVGGWWPTLNRPEQLGRFPRFIVALGVDARGDGSLKGHRADTIQIGGLDGQGGGGVMGVARDTWTGRAKINAAWATGGGPGQVRALRTLTGLPLEGYVATGFGGFRAIVDGWGGIPVVLDKALKGKVTSLDLPAGPHTLTGTEALAFARERKALPDGDFGRSRHQGQILVGVALKARLAGVGSVPESLTLVGQHAESDLSAEAMLTYAAALYRLSPAKVGRWVAKGSTPMIAGQSVVVLDAASKAKLKEFRDGRL